MHHHPSRDIETAGPGIFARHFFSFDAAANGVDGLPERIFSDGPIHLSELGGRRIL